ncbi:dihydrofolate reductase-like domain-containing protein [Panaeolus papilionaceus]|nr:dihydrofolate reductase-like domain-containing protein [Panaeolus papilionaceus]
MSRLTIIVAATKANGIGVNARLPWRLPKEMKYFAQVTSHAPEGQQNAVIMGRNTWESIPQKFRPLPKRTNIVISRNTNYALGITEGAVLEHNLQSALSLLEPSASSNLYRGFIIGGATLYNESLNLALSTATPSVDRILLTRILQPDFQECDAFMPDFLQSNSSESEWKRSSHEELSSWVGFEVPAGEQEENGVKYEFQMWVRE